MNNKATAAAVTVAVSAVAVAVAEAVRRRMGRRSRTMEIVKQLEESRAPRRRRG